LVHRHGDCPCEPGLGLGTLARGTLAADRLARPSCQTLNSADGVRFELLAPCQ